MKSQDHNRNDYFYLNEKKKKKSIDVNINNYDDDDKIKPPSFISIESNLGNVNRHHSTNNYYVERNPVRRDFIHNYINQLTEKLSCLTLNSNSLGTNWNYSKYSHFQFYDNYPHIHEINKNNNHNSNNSEDQDDDDDDDDEHENYADDVNNLKNIKNKDVTSSSSSSSLSALNHIEIPLDDDYNESSPSVELINKVNKKKDRVPSKKSVESKLVEKQNVLQCLKDYYIAISNEPKSILIETLKQYSLGVDDKLQCCLCCIIDFDLTGFKTNKPNTKNNNKNETIYYNKNNLNLISTHLRTYNPFIRKNSLNYSKDCSNENKKPDRVIIPCNKNNRKNEKKKYGMRNSSQNNSNSCNSSLVDFALNNNSNSNLTRIESNQSGRGEDVVKVKSLKSDKIKDIVDCLKDFNLIFDKSNAGESRENEKIYNDKKPRANSSNLKNNLLKYKRIPLCRDQNGNLIANINIPEKLSRKVHGISSSLIPSNDNSKLSIN